MRICSNCGTMVEETERLCPCCGAVMPQPDSRQNQQPVQQQSYQQPVQQQSYQQPVQQQYQQPAAQDKYQGYPMKWYKFLVYFLLWFGVLLNAVNGVRIMTGAQYGDDADLVYAVLPAMKTGDVIIGILVLCMAVFGIITAVKLLGMAKIGPKLLIAMYVINLVISIAYIAFVLIVAKDILDTKDALTPSNILSFALSLIMISVNWVYFKKRESLFVN